MSAYLMIKKNGTTMGSWSRNSAISKLFIGKVTYDNWSEFDPESVFKDGLVDISDDIDEKNQMLAKYETAIKYCNSADSFFDVSDTIDDLKSELNNLIYYQHAIMFMQNSYFESKMFKEPNDWTWCIA